MFPIEHVRVIDGDAIEATVLLPFGQQFRGRIRLKGWWADEIAGAYGNDGLEARRRLESFVTGKALYLLSPSGRKDRYGRIIGSLWHHERMVNPKDVLKELQLSEEIHKKRLDASRTHPKVPSVWP